MIKVITEMHLVITDRIRSMSVMAFPKTPYNNEIINSVLLFECVFSIIILRDYNI